MNYLYILANSIRNFRNSRRWTQEEFAEFLGVSVNHVQNIENMRRKPSLAILHQLYLHGFSIDSALSEQQDECASLKNNLHVLINNCSEEQLKDLTAILGVLQRNRYLSLLYNLIRIFSTIYLQIGKQFSAHASLARGSQRLPFYLRRHPRYLFHFCYKFMTIISF